MYADRMHHLQAAEVAVAWTTALLPEAQIFPDMMKMTDAPYVCIHASSLIALVAMAQGGV